MSCYGGIPSGQCFKSPVFSTGRLRCHDELDADKSQVRLLRNDHLKMLEDLDDWRSKTEP